VEALPADLASLVAEGGVKALDAIPGVGHGIAAALAEMVKTGRWAYLNRLRGIAEPEDLFCSVPGIGAALARRLHEQLNVETLEQLEAALHDPAAARVRGLGTRRLAALRASLNQTLSRIRPVRTLPEAEPPIEMMLSVDEEYRRKAKAGALRQIAPARFNPKREAWLPILHTARDGWHFTALYSNTARAHDLGKTSDWVVLYFHADGGGEAQRTVVTETRGSLIGQRVVRGRERDSAVYYARQPAA
jgi:hypothetical protein